MTGRERVLRSMDFKEPDRVPRFLGFSEEFARAWKARAGGGPELDPGEHFGSDMMVVAADETAWPLSAGVVREDGQSQIRRTGWGVVERTRRGAFFSEALETRVRERVDPDSLEFDDVALNERYTQAGEAVKVHRHAKAVFCKTGGPYLRAAFMRGQEEFLIDIAEDPQWVRAFVERVADHITGVGVESIGRFRLQETGIAVYDDVCYMAGPVMGPKAYEELFYPSLCRMVKAYKEAGAARVIHHCDGDVRRLLEMWVEAGIDAVHPCEPRTGYDPMEIKERFGTRLTTIGGLDNTRVLPGGRRREIRKHIEGVLAAAAGGGLVLSCGELDDVSVETMEYVLELLEELGRYPLDRAARGPEEGSRK